MTASPLQRNTVTQIGLSLHADAATVGERGRALDGALRARVRALEAALSAQAAE